MHWSCSYVLLSNHVPEGSRRRSTKYLLESDTGSTATPGNLSTGHSANSSPEEIGKGRREERWMRKGKRGEGGGGKEEEGKKGGGEGGRREEGRGGRRRGGKEEGREGGGKEEGERGGERRREGRRREG